MLIKYIINTFDAKQTYRTWTGGGNHIHASNTPEESEHDLVLLLGKNLKDVRDSLSKKWDGKIKNINSKSTFNWIKTKKPDYIFCFGYSSIIKKPLITEFKNKIIGFHPTLLPNNRGKHPIIWSIILGLKKMSASQIMLCNRTKSKAEDLKNFFGQIEVVDWGETPNFDMIINATSVGLKKDDKINFDYSKIGSNKFFYDIIYNPKETTFLKRAREFGNKTENGKMMFIYQAHQAFTIWHKVMPNIDEETIKLLD